MGITTTEANLNLNHRLRAVADVAPATVYVSLHTAAPGDAGANELAGGSYARQAVTFGAAAAKAVANTNVLNFTCPAATVTHWALWDALAGGNCLHNCAAAAPIVAALGDIYSIPIGALTVTIA